jgi:enoyl-CoA hydratase/carnithine racemase
MVSVETPSIDIEADEDVVTIALNRPEKLNALTEEMVVGIHSAWSQLSENPEKAVLFTGRGDATCAGADTSVIEDDDFSETESEYSHLQQETFQMIQTYPRPTVTACKGVAVGAAIIFAADSDFAILGADTTFSYPETKLGLFSDRLPKLLQHNHGGQVAREVTLKSEQSDPERALELGLVTEVVPEDEVDSTARALVEQLAEYEETAVEMVKDCLEFEFDPDNHVGYP